MSSLSPNMSIKVCILSYGRHPHSGLSKGTYVDFLLNFGRFFRYNLFVFGFSKMCPATKL